MNVMLKNLHIKAKGLEVKDNLTQKLVHTNVQLFIMKNVREDENITKKENETI